jgi:hypothetical protein
VHANREPLVHAPDRLLQRLVELLHVPSEGDCALIVKHVREAQQPIVHYEHDAAIDTEVTSHCKHLSTVVMQTMSLTPAATAVFTVAAEVVVPLELSLHLTRSLFCTCALVQMTLVGVIISACAS